jgi:hypothetical protein
VPYSLLGTAKLNGQNPEAYLREVLTRLADHPINRINELMPWNLQATNPDPLTGDATPTLPALSRVGWQHNSLRATKTRIHELLPWHLPAPNFATGETRRPNLPPSASSAHSTIAFSPSRRPPVDAYGAKMTHRGLDMKHRIFRAIRH